MRANDVSGPLMGERGGRGWAVYICVDGKRIHQQTDTITPKLSVCFPGFFKSVTGILSGRSESRNLESGFSTSCSLFSMVFMFFYWENVWIKVCWFLLLHSTTYTWWVNVPPFFMVVPVLDLFCRRISLHWREEQLTTPTWFRSPDWNMVLHGVPFTVSCDGGSKTLEHHPQEAKLKLDGLCMSEGSEHLSITPPPSLNASLLCSAI